MYMRDNLPTGRVLDYGCGGGNNSMFFIEQGYETYGVDVADAALPLIKTNLQSRHLDSNLIDRFSLIAPDSTVLPFESGFFDFILSNQVLYYLPSERHIRDVCRELSRCLRPGGAVFFTMMGPTNYYITHHAKQIHRGNIYEIAIDDHAHRLHGVREMIYLVKDSDELKNLFSEFECLSTGYFDQSMFDLKSAFHWIFIGQKS
jgi:SAM-dependent methyltransferase